MGPPLRPAQIAVGPGTDAFDRPSGTDHVPLEGNVCASRIKRAAVRAGSEGADALPGGGQQATEWLVCGRVPEEQASRVAPHCRRAAVAQDSRSFPHRLPSGAIGALPCLQRVYPAAPGCIHIDMCN